MTTIRLMLAIAGAFLTLSSCAGGSDVPAGSNQTALGARNAHQLPPSQGGDFTAKESGKWNVRKGQCGTFCDTWRFHGTGTATFFGSAKEHGAVTGGFGVGNAVIAESGSTDNFIRVHLNGGFCSPHLSYTVSGGKGIYKSATGSGTIHFSCTGKNRGTYNDTWSGTLYY